MSVIVPTDQPSIYDALSTLEMQGTLLALVRPNNPPPGIAGFLLDVVEDDGSELESSITDYFVEDNTAIQDHISLHSEVVTVTGSVAELVLAAPVPANQTTVPNTLPLVPGQGPQLTPGAQTAQDATTQAAAANQSAAVSNQSLYGYYQSHSPQQPKQTKQSLAYGYLYQLWKGRQLFSVDTPWGLFNNMAVLSLSSKQGAMSKSVTEFSITFKKIRVAGSIVIQAGQLAGRAVEQQAPITQQGFIGQQSLTDAQTTQFVSRMSPVNLSPIQ